MSKDLLNIIEAVANEKEVDRSVIIEALEAALAAATRKRYPDEEIGAKVVINPRTGEYKSFRLWTVVDDEAILENPDAEMRESVAAIEFPDAHLQVGDVHEVPIENEPFGRISAQQAKQIIIQKLREAERRKVYDQFIADEGTLVHGIVRRYERGNVIVDINGAEATILRDGMIPRETLRIGDRIRGYLAKVNLEMRGPQLEVSRVAPEMLKQLFTLEVPEIGSGIIEIMGVARAPGVRAKIAVRTFDPRIDPVGACVGKGRGQRIHRRDHQVHVDGHADVRAQRLADHRPHRQVGNVVVVHHVEMQKIRACGLDGLHFFLQPAEVGRKHAGSDPVCHVACPALEASVE